MLSYRSSCQGGLAALLVGLSAAMAVAQAPRAFERVPTAAAPVAMPQRRTALVIGNAAYDVGPLPNPVNDATDMAATLRQLGFEVTPLHDATYNDMETAVNTFHRQLRQGGMGLFYFAGHGLQVEGQNYLIPINARITRESEVKHRAVNATWVLEAMQEAGNGLNVMILDACRNNPYARQWRSTKQGLAGMAGARGVLVVYATSPDQVADDGSGRNGVYTKHLLRELTTPGVRVMDVVIRVTAAVEQETAGRQIPWFSGTLTENFVVAPEPPQTYTNSIGMEFVLILAGTFQMGSTAAEVEKLPLPRPPLRGFKKWTWFEVEGPQHQVTISQEFYLGKYEVTQGQWHAVMGHNPSHFPQCGAECPVENVSWKDVQAFIERLNAREGHMKYRLPTEAEWEYAARAGMETPVYTGELTIHGWNNAPALDTIAWYGGNSGVTYAGGSDCLPRGQYPATCGPHPVGRKQPNRFGLYDMLGNVWEWVQDWDGAYPAGPVTDPQGPDSGWARVNRGCGWGSGAHYCRSARRIFSAPGRRHGTLGFRLLRTAP
jgi:formylglycine-generating enzyme required for sulfatase activity